MTVGKLKFMIVESLLSIVIMIAIRLVFCALGLDTC